MVSSHMMDEKKSGTLLGKALTGNGLFSLASGLVLAAAATYLSRVLGAGPPEALRFIGFGLLLYGGFLIWAASQRPINRTLAVAAILMDIAWVLGSAVLLLTPFVPFTLAGKWMVAILADVVAIFAIAQYLGLRSHRPVGSN